jgi:hypothetical protein
MPQYVIEREIAGLGESTGLELQAVAEKSNGVLRELGTDVQWVHSYVTGDKMYCVYNATGEDIVREHARRGGFPADLVAEVTAVFGTSGPRELPV